LPSACPRQAFKITALDMPWDFSRSKRGGSDVLLSTPPFVGFSRAARLPSSRAQAEGSSRRSLASGAFLTGLKIEFFNTLIYA
ncbi:MAG: hypothetical protein V3U06_12960, partial [Candidatus Binatia bacterium]